MPVSRSRKARFETARVFAPGSSTLLSVQVPAQILGDEFSGLADRPHLGRVGAYAVEETFGTTPGRPPLGGLVRAVAGDEKPIIRHETVNGEGMVVDGQHPLVRPNLADAAHSNPIPLLQKVVDVAGVSLGLGHDQRELWRGGADERTGFNPWIRRAASHR